VKMAPLRILAALALTVGSAAAFSPVAPFAARTAVSTPSTTDLKVSYEEAMSSTTETWNSEWPQFAKYGWGPSVQAEKWNGRHAMFGWVFIMTTAYCKGHGLIPDADVPLDLKEWGTLATISGKSTLTNERAIVLIANVHFLMVSVCAALCPLPFSDPLLLDTTSPMYEKALAQNKEGYGYLPAMKMGVTEEAEIMNGRLAMLGLGALLFTTVLEDKPMLDVVNEWIGGAYF